MPKILKVNTPSDYSRYLGHTDRHPLVSVIEYSRISPIRHSLNSYGVYGIFLQDNNNLDLVYGCGKYDYKDGSLISEAKRIMESLCLLVDGQCFSILIF